MERVNTRSQSAWKKMSLSATRRMKRYTGLLACTSCPIDGVTDPSQIPLVDAAKTAGGTGNKSSGLISDSATSLPPAGLASGTASGSGPTLAGGKKASAHVVHAHQARVDGVARRQGVATSHRCRRHPLRAGMGVAPPSIA